MGTNPTSPPPIKTDETPDTGNGTGGRLTEDQVDLGDPAGKASESNHERQETEKLQGF
jgi:hypothetical protein